MFLQRTLVLTGNWPQQTRFGAGYAAVPGTLILLILSVDRARGSLVCAHVCACVRMLACMCVYICACMCMCVCVSMCVCCSLCAQLTRCLDEATCICGKQSLVHADISALIPYDLVRPASPLRASVNQCQGEGQPPPGHIYMVIAHTAA